MLNSIFNRLVFFSLIILAVFFAILDYGARHVFTESVYSARLAELRLQNYLLVNAAGINDNQIYFPEPIPEQDFNRVDSGIYGLISNQRGELLWQSPSTGERSFNSTDFTAPNIAVGEIASVVSQQFLAHHQVVNWEVIDDRQERITFTVLEDIGPANADVALYMREVRSWFIPAAIALLVALGATLRFGLNPLQLLARRLKKLEKGELQTLSGNVPQELQDITRNLNSLLLAEKQQRERYQNTLANLAHSIKTPLAVIQNELESHPAPNKSDNLLLQQVQRIDDIVQHQLHRAVISAPHALSENVSVYDCCEQISQALQKVYRDKQLDIQLAFNPQVVFKGDQRDLMEMLGNLLDNACKACQQHIVIEASNQPGKLLISIADDGPGIPPTLRDKVLLRGMRSDSDHQGQGLGLNTVADIVDSYQGKINIGQSSLGGALFTLTIPMPSNLDTDGKITFSDE